jgi:hypothetical protein
MTTLEQAVFLPGEHAASTWTEPGFNGKQDEQQDNN